MLKELLKEIDQSKVYSKKTLANKLDTSENMVNEGLNHLMNMGYIENDIIGGSCNFKCAGCPIKTCSLNPINALVITDKGKKLLENT